MNKTERALIRSAELVKSWGKVRLSGDRSLEEALTIGGVSFWDVLAPSLTIGSVAATLGRRDSSELMSSQVLFKRRCKSALFDAALPILGNSGGCRQWPRDSAFLFMGFSNYMFRETLSPVAENISKHKGCSSVVLNDSRNIGASDAGRSGPVFSSIWQHWNASATAEARALRKELHKAVIEIAKGGALLEIVADGGRSLFPNLKNTLNCLFTVSLPRLMDHMAVARHILTEHRPKLIISPDVNDPRIRIYTLLGRTLKVPSLDVQLGAAVKSNTEWRFFESDHLAVNGECNRDVMLFHGIPPEKITITGSPRYDYIFRHGQDSRRKTRLELKLLDKNLVLLFASQPYVPGSFTGPRIRVEMIKALFKAVSGIDGLTLVVKPHPLEDVGELEDLVGDEKSSILFVEKKSDVRGLIFACDAFTSFFSTTIFDALVMSKPTILISFPKSTDCAIFTESGAALLARSGEDIRARIKEIISGLSPVREAELGSARAVFLEKWLYKTDGSATERISSLALSLAGQPPQNMEVVEK